MSNAVAMGEKFRKQEAMENLVDEISRGEDDSLAPSLRSAFEREWGFQFIATISDARIKREREIEKICSRHYGDFLASVKELLEMRGSADLISRSITEVHEVFEDAYRDLSTVLKTLESLQIERENSRSALDDIQKCKELTILMVKAKEYIASENYYRALSTIETLRDALGKVGMRPFASLLLKWLSQLIDQLLAASKVEMHNWLNEMKVHNALTGETFMRLRAAAFIREYTLAAGGLVEIEDYDGLQCVADTPICMSTEMVQRLADLYGWDLLDYSCQVDKTIPHDCQDVPSVDGRMRLDSITELCGPLHKALHMHSRLGRMAQLQGIYCESRELIIIHNLISSTIETNIKSNGLELVFPDVMHALCGFFTTESIIRRSLANPEGGGVFTWNQLKDLWLIACSQVRDCLTRHKDSVASVAAMLQIKEEIVLASETLADDAFGFRDGALMETCTVLWDPFLKLIADSVQDTVMLCLNSMAYQPMYMNSEFLHEELIVPFALDRTRFTLDDHIGKMPTPSMKTRTTNASLDALEEEQMELLRQSIASLDENAEALGRVTEGKLQRDGDTSDSLIRGGSARISNFVPHTLPFSEMVPRVMKHLHLMVVYCSQFVVYNDSLGERGSSVCKTFEGCITIIAAELQMELTKDGTETPLSKACQIYVDACTFSYTCKGFRDTLASMLIQSNWIESIDSHLDDVISRCRGVLDNLANQSQGMIFELLNAKVIDLLGSMVFVNWLPVTLPPGPHEFVEEIVEYLQVTFMWLSHLPLTVREAAHFTCCSKINQEIIAFLLSPKVPNLNMLSAKALVLDFAFLEKFADGCGIAQLRECFAEGKSLVNALIHRDLPSFGDDPPTLRKANFPLLDVYKFPSLVEKLVPLPSNAQVNGSIPIYDKKTLAAIIKSIKASRN